MVSNLIKLSLGSILLFFAFSCIYTKKKTIAKNTNNCEYIRYNIGQTISNLGCKNCHIEQILGMENILTFNELSKLDSLALINYTFTKKHNGWYSKDGDFKSARMDTLSVCEIRNIIRYIKDSGRDIPMPTQ